MSEQRERRPSRGTASRPVRGRRRAGAAVAVARGEFDARDGRHAGRRCAAGGGAARAARRTSSQHGADARAASTRARPQLGRVGARARPAASAAGRRRPRVRRRLSGDRGGALGAARDGRRSIGRRARARASSSPRRRRVRNITWKRGELEQLPIATRSMDIALLSQALHHAAHRRARSPRRTASCGPAAACWCSTCASTASLGAAEARRPVARLQRRAVAGAACTAPDFIDVTRARRRASARAIRSPCSLQRARTAAESTNHVMHRCIGPTTPTIIRMPSCSPSASSSSTARWAR